MTGAPVLSGAPGGRYLRASLHYRALHEFREAVSVSGPFGIKLKVLSYLVLCPSSVVVALQIYRYVFKMSEAALPVAVPGMIVIGTFYYFIIASELFKEISFTPDLALLLLSPVAPAEILMSRLLFAGVRLIPLHLSVMAFPISVTICVLPSRTNPVVFVAWAVAFFASIQMLSLRTAVGLAEMSGKTHIPRELISSTTLVAGVLAASAAGFAIMDSAFWKWWQHLLWWAGSPNPVLCSSGIALLGLTVWLYLDSVHHWANTAIPPHPRHTREVGTWWGIARFSENPAIAVLQKDCRDLLRNPAYRSALIGCSVLLVVALVALWRTGGAGDKATRRMMTALALLYLVPMFVSARTLTLEKQMIGFYRLVLPEAAKLLDWKLQAQAAVNCLTCFILALPLFVLGRVNPMEPVRYAAAVIICVPLLTALAIAIGAFFPASSTNANPIGIRIPGLLAYAVPSVILYSVLLSRMIIAGVLYLLFLAPVTAALYVLGRLRLREL